MGRSGRPVGCRRRLADTDAARWPAHGRGRPVVERRGPTVKHVSLWAAVLIGACRSEPVPPDGGRGRCGPDEHLCGSACAPRDDPNHCGQGCVRCPALTPACDTNRCVCVADSCGPGRQCVDGACTAPRCTLWADCNTPGPCQGTPA